jgi:hypothetical protein
VYKSAIKNNATGNDLFGFISIPIMSTGQFTRYVDTKASLVVTILASLPGGGREAKRQENFAKRNTANRRR